MMRKSIPHIDQSKATSAAESFQNTVIRQVVKGSHEWLIISFQQYLTLNHVNLCVLEEDKKREYIDSVFSKDHQYRHFLAGVVAGQFTTGELMHYHQNQQELNKRIVKIIRQRIQDSIEEICPQ